MSKEYLEAFGRITLHTEYDSDSSYDGLSFEEDYKLVDEALQRLEAIDSSNTGEALKALKELRVIANMYCRFNGTQCEHNKELADIIEKALLKAQDTKKYLTWEDLIFSKEPTYIKATLNSIRVTIKCWKEYMKEWCSVDFNNAPCNNMMFVHHGYDDDTDTQTTIFDALGFERVEE